MPKNIAWRWKRQKPEARIKPLILTRFQPGGPAGIRDSLNCFNAIYERVFLVASFQAIPLDEELTLFSKTLLTVMFLSATDHAIETYPVAMTSKCQDARS
jgi:hypothetical protein